LSNISVSFSREAILTFILFPILVVIAYAADKQWLNPLFCKKTPTVSDKQRQIELGTFSPGEESTYRTDFFIFSFRFFLGRHLPSDVLFLVFVHNPVAATNLWRWMCCALL
jgi:hypothetical protein